MQRLLLVLLSGWLLLASREAIAEPFLYAEPGRQRVPAPATYHPPLPVDLAPNRTLGRLEAHFQVIGEWPNHLVHRTCRPGAPEREWILEAMRRTVGDDPLERLRWSLALGGCPERRDAASLCDFTLEAAEREADPSVREFLVWRAVDCATSAQAGFFEGRDLPDAAVVAFHRRHPDLVGSERLATAVRSLARGAEARALAEAVAVFGRRDDPGVTRLLLALHDEVSDPDRRRILGLGLRHQSAAPARKVFGEAYRADCERRRAARERAGTARGSVRPGSALLHVLGYTIDAPLRCESPPPPSRPPEPADLARPEQVSTPQELRVAAIEAALRRFGHETRVLRFSPDEAGPYGQHAPALRRLSDLVRPRLDDAVFRDVWPALESLELDRGPHRAHVLVNGRGVVVGVADRGGEPDAVQAQQIAAELTDALAQPHFLDAHVAGERYRFQLRGLGEYLDVETLVGAANTLLRERGSDWRVLILEPFDVLELVSGPRRVLLDAVEAGDLRPGAPFAAARLRSDFDPSLLE